jgi:hypothetical protein
VSQNSRHLGTFTQASEYSGFNSVMKQIPETDSYCNCVHGAYQMRMGYRPIILHAPPYWPELSYIYWEDMVGSPSWGIPCTYCGPNHRSMQWIQTALHRTIITRQVQQRAIFYCHLTDAGLTGFVNDNNRTLVSMACQLQCRQTRKHTHTHTQMQPKHPPWKITRQIPSIRPFTYHHYHKLCLGLR